EEALVRELCGIRDWIRGGDRCAALARLLYVLGDLSDALDPDNRLDVSTAVAALGGDLNDLNQGRPVAWATRSWAMADRQPYARLPSGRGYRDFREWLLRQLAVVGYRVFDGDRRDAVVELIGTARECALVLIEGE